MKSWYDCLKNGDFPMDKVTSKNTGVDAFLSDDDEKKDVIHGDRTASEKALRTGSIRVASVSQLDGFTRVSSNTLVRMSEKDLWEIKEDDNGDYVVERLFDDDGNPLEV